MSKNIPLSEDLISWRADRPDEWTMDRFIRDATKLEQERNELAAQVEQLKRERGDALAEAVRYQSLLEYVIRVEEFKSIIGDLEIMMDCGERK